MVGLLSFILGPLQRPLKWHPGHMPPLHPLRYTTAHTSDSNDVIIFYIPERLTQGHAETSFCLAAAPHDFSGYNIVSYFYMVSNAFFL